MPVRGRLVAVEQDPGEREGKTCILVIDHGGPNLLRHPVTGPEGSAMAESMGVRSLADAVGKSIILDRSQGQWTTTEEKR